jgi:hypothetical protein
MRYLFLFLFLLMSFALSGCSWFHKAADNAKDVAIDCGKGELANLKPVAKAMVKPLVAGQLTMKDIESAAISSGARFGGCLLAHLNDLIPRAEGFAVGDPTPPELALQNLRQATSTNYRYRTSGGTL